MQLNQKILFSEEECDFLINYKSNGIKRPHGGYLNHSGINYKQWTINRNEDLEFLFTKVISFTEETFNIKVTNFSEPAWIYQYEINDGYIMHTDDILNRCFTIGIQLNNEYEGGDLIIDYNGKRIIVNKEIGNCYIFESALLHGVSPITSGNRYNFLTFMHSYNITINKISLI